jgi:hypothetical protein
LAELPLAVLVADLGRKLFQAHISGDLYNYSLTLPDLLLLRPVFRYLFSLFLHQTQMVSKFFNFRVRAGEGEGAKVPNFLLLIFLVFILLCLLLHIAVERL